MTPLEKFNQLFKRGKAVMGMIHLKGEGREDVLARAAREVHLLLDNGVDAVIIENYFGSPEDVAGVLERLQDELPDALYGVNVLDDDALGFRYAREYRAKFIQLDSVAGHLAPGEDALFGKNIAKWRAETDALVLGGVRFKYQPYNSGRSLEEDLAIGMRRCDAIVVTGDGTGEPTPMEKIREFRRIIGDFPLIVGAGITPDTCGEQLAMADGAIVGSYFKDTHVDNGDVDPGHVKDFMRAVAECGAGG
jgi:Predicted TIM-barrel enzyme